jgi:hypothetical protein
MTTGLDVLRRYRGQMVVPLADMLEGIQTLLASDTLEEGSMDTESARYAKLTCNNVAINPRSREAWLTLVNLVESTDQSERCSRLFGTVDRYPHARYHGACFHWKGNDRSGRRAGGSPFIIWFFDFQRNRVECRWSVGFSARTDFQMPERFIERLIPGPAFVPTTTE